MNKKDLDDKLTETKYNTRLEVIQEVRTFNKDYIEFIGENAMRISEEISEIIIFSDDQKINTELYIEEC